MPGLQTREQLLGGYVYQFQRVGRVENVVGNRFPDGDARDLSNHVVEAFDVLDVQRSPNVDARSQKIIYILPALGMTRTFSIGVGKFIQQEHVGASGQGGVHVELPQLHATVVDLLDGQGFQAGQEGQSIGTRMRFDVADDDLPALPREPAGRSSASSRVLPTPAA